MAIEDFKIYLFTFFNLLAELKCPQSQNEMKRWLLPATVAQVSAPKCRRVPLGRPRACAHTTLCCGPLGRPFVRAPASAWCVSQFLPLTMFVLNFI